MPPPEIYKPVDYKSWATALDPPIDKLAWRDQARELIVLRWPSYSFDPDQGWHERASCWIGRNARAGATAGLLCIRTEPSSQDLADFIRYIQGIRGSNTGVIDAIIAIQQGRQKKEIVVDGIKISLETEESLLARIIHESETRS